MMTPSLTRNTTARPRDLPGVRDIKLPDLERSAGARPGQALFFNATQPQVEGSWLQLAIGLRQIGE